MAKGLTEKQRKILEFIIDFQRENSFPPTIRETGDAFGIGSLRGVTVHLDALVRKGFVTRDRTSRSIRVIAPDPRNTGGTRSERDAVPSSSRNRPDPALMLPLIRSFSIADKALLGGKTAMGEAIIERHVSVPDEIAASATEEGFVIRVGATGIYGEPALPGDLLVVRPQRNAQRGELVVSLSHGDVSIFRYSGHASETDSGELGLPVSDDAEIVGRVVGMIRRY